MRLAPDLADDLDVGAVGKFGEVAGHDEGVENFGSGIEGGIAAFVFHFPKDGKMKAEELDAHDGRFEEFAVDEELFDLVFRFIEGEPFQFHETQLRHFELSEFIEDEAGVHPVEEDAGHASPLIASSAHDSLIEALIDAVAGSSLVVLVEFADQSQFLFILFHEVVFGGREAADADGDDVISFEPVFPVGVVIGFDDAVAGVFFFFGFRVLEVDDLFVGDAGGGEEEDGDEE